MKKIFYSLILALPFFTSCEEEDFGVKAADPQTWEQEEAITLDEPDIRDKGFFAKLAWVFNSKKK